MWDPDPFATVQASVKRPVAPPAAGPCDAPLVCVQFNEEYVPFVAGALTQWIQREAFLAASEDDLQLALANFTWLAEIFGTAVQCSQPPLIPGQPTLSRACNIAGYLSNYVIRESLQQGANSVANTLAIATTVWGIVRFIPGFAEALPLTWLAVSGLLAAISAVGVPTFTTAINDPTLWGAITCAIYNAIAADGQVTAANFPAIITNITAITFADAGVKSAVLDYINNLGPAGLQALQTGGPFTDYDCSGCATGPALGPVGPSPFRLSGSDLLTIAIGAADAILAIAFPSPFDTPPLLTASSDNEDLIVSFVGTTPTGTTLRITSAVPVTAATSAEVNWTASLPGID